MKIELVFIPLPGIGHRRPAIELAKRLVGNTNHLSITVIIIPSINDVTGESPYIASLLTTCQDRLRYEAISVEDQTTADLQQPTQVYIKKQKPKVRDIVVRIINDPTRRLVGFVVDMFCFSMIDVADEFNIPTYMVYTSNTAFLGITLHLQFMHDDKKYDVSELEDSVTELEFPCLTLPYPVKCLPYLFTSKRWLTLFLAQARCFRRMKGILVNTVAELEPHALKMFNNGGDLPQVYPIGPVLHLGNGFNDDEKQSEILRWLDEQPDKSVVFLCFGSMGGFNEEQTREIAVALDRSGYKFLWSLRCAPSNILTERPGDFKNLEEVLPVGLLNKGKVIGWAPQVAVLAKPAIGGFVTHCGWNSILESLWFGVPMVTWPLHSEQKVNAFEMVEELGLAVEIRKYLRGDLLAGEMDTVTAEEIEKAIKSVMEQDDNDVRIRVKEMAEKCHVAVTEGGSSQVALQKFIQDVVENID